MTKTGSFKISEKSSVLKMTLFKIVLLQGRHFSEYVTSKAQMCLGLIDFLKYCNLEFVNEWIMQVKAWMFKINAILICTGIFHIVRLKIWNYCALTCCFLKMMFFVESDCFKSILINLLLNVFFQMFLTVLVIAI